MKSKIENNFKFRWCRIVISLQLLSWLVLVGCSGSTKFVRNGGSDTLAYYDKYSIPEPEEKEINLTWHDVDQNFFYRLERFFDLPSHLKTLFGYKQEAKDVNAFDEVNNSSWFINRNAKSLMSVEEIGRGPNASSGPDFSQPWTVIKAKTEGVTPGFSIKDAKGDLYLLKFDPPGYPELVSAAEVITTKLFYAAGYNTPENYMVYFEPEQIQLAPDVSYKDKTGKKKVMTDDYLDSLLARLPKNNQGKIRAMASKFIKNAKGPFSYRGTRKDDPNDRINHENRRELRGLKVLCAWLNHHDTKDHNTLDAYVTEEGKSYLKHHLIDFGSTLGSAATGSKSATAGYAHTVDVEYSLQNLLSAGLIVQPWEKADSVWHPAIGYFESEIFDPASWKPINPNVAFNKMTDRDGFWGAKLVASFSDEQIKAAVKSGEFSDPVAEEYLVETLIKRRDKIVNYWFSKVNHLDQFSLTKNSDGTIVLDFSDLLSQAESPRSRVENFRYILHTPSKKLGTVRNSSSKPYIILDNEIISVLYSQSHYDKKSKENNIFFFEIQCTHQNPEEWGPKIKVYFRYHGKESTPELVGIER